MLYGIQKCFFGNLLQCSVCIANQSDENLGQKLTKTVEEKILICLNHLYDNKYQSGTKML